MRVYRATPVWSRVLIDAAKDMGGYALSNLGDVGIRANKLTTTNLLLKELDAGGMTLKNLADNALRSLDVHNLYVSNSIPARVSGVSLCAADVAGGYMPLAAKDTAGVLTTVASLKGAATAYFNLLGGRARMDDVDIRTQMMLWGLVS